MKTIILIALSLASAAHGAATEKTGPLCEGFSTVHSWENRNLISDAPALVKLPDGTLLCSVQLWSRQADRGQDNLAQELYGRKPMSDLGRTETAAKPGVKAAESLLRPASFFATRPACISSVPKSNGRGSGSRVPTITAGTWSEPVSTRRERCTLRQPDGRFATGRSTLGPPMTCIPPSNAGLCSPFRVICGAIRWSRLRGDSPTTSIIRGCPSVSVAVRTMAANGWSRMWSTSMASCW